MAAASSSYPRRDITWHLRKTLDDHDIRGSLKINHGDFERCLLPYMSRNDQNTLQTNGILTDLVAFDVDRKKDLSLMLLKSKQHYEFTEDWKEKCVKKLGLKGGDEVGFSCDAQVEGEKSFLFTSFPEQRQNEAAGSSSSSSAPPRDVWDLRKRLDEADIRAGQVLFKKDDFKHFLQKMSEDDQFTMRHSRTINCLDFVYIDEREKSKDIKVKLMRVDGNYIFTAHMTEKDFEFHKLGVKLGDEVGFRCEIQKDGERKYFFKKFPKKLTQKHKGKNIVSIVNIGCGLFGKPIG